MEGNRLKEEAVGLLGDLVAWRRRLHRHPELAFQETRTAAFVEEQLRGLGLDVRPGVARTGVVGILRAPSPTGPAVLLRADMDALPVQEVPGREYGSVEPGKMHACGHDGHVAMLLGAARLLTARKRSLPRDVVFCFQPAEEGHGGAREMVAEGVLEQHGVGRAYAVHLWSALPAGSIHVRAGPFMAGADEFAVRVVGRGGHGAEPHRASDPIVAAAQCVVALQSVVSRNVVPGEAAVVTVGSVHAGDAPNVIPGEARLEGTLRAFTDEVRRTLRTRVREVFESTASSARCKIDFELRPGYPPVVNDAAATATVRRAAAEVVGEERVGEPAPLTAAEDFAFFLEKVRGAFVLVGSGNEALGITAPHHAPDFDIDESVLPVGAELLTRLALVD